MVLATYTMGRCYQRAGQLSSQSATLRNGVSQLESGIRHYQASYKLQVNLLRLINWQQV